TPAKTLSDKPTLPSHRIIIACILLSKNLVVAIIHVPAARSPMPGNRTDFPRNRSPCRHGLLIPFGSMLSVRKRDQLRSTLSPGPKAGKGDRTVITYRDFQPAGAGMARGCDVDQAPWSKKKGDIFTGGQLTSATSGAPIVG